MNAVFSFEKQHLCTLPACYAVTPLQIAGRMHYLFAPDDTGPCLCIDAETGAQETVWEGPGGTMSMVPLPHKEGAFLASQCFFPGFHARESRIVHVSRKDGCWTVRPWMEIPYVHRFDLLERGGVRYLLACVLSDTEKPEADWNVPGCLLAGALGENGAPPASLSVIAGGMTRNHGYFRTGSASEPAAYTACDEGVFRVAPPAYRGGDWEVQKILDGPASDVAVCDFDGDGQEEIAVIRPFHGDDFSVYRPDGDGGYVLCYRYPYRTDFLHAIYGGKLCGRPVFLCGCRAERQELFVLFYADGAPRVQEIESGFGPSNLAVIPGKETDFLLVANREHSEGAVFAVSVKGK